MNAHDLEIHLNLNVYLLVMGKLILIINSELFEVIENYNFQFKSIII